MSNRMCVLCGKMVSKLTQHIANNHSLASPREKATALLTVRKQRSDAKVKNASKMYIKCAYDSGEGICGRYILENG